MSLATVIVTAFILLATSVYAQQVVRNIERDEGNVHVLGDNVMVKEGLAGDLYGVSGLLSIEGVVEGDVVYASSNITIDGSVVGDIRTASETMRVSGNVSGDINSFSNSLYIEEGTTVGGDLKVAVVAFADVKGIVRGDVSISSDGEVNVSGNILGDLNVVAKKINIADGTRIEGDFAYRLHNDKQLNISDNVFIGGETKISEKGYLFKSSTVNDGSIFVEGLVSFFGIFFASLILFFISRRWVSKFTEYNVGNAFLNIVFGIVFLVLGFLISAILLFVPFVTVVGILLMFTIILLFFMSVLLSPVVVASYFSKFIGSGGLASNIVSLAIVAIAFVLLGYIGITSIIIVLVALFTLGALARTIQSSLFG